MLTAEHARVEPNTEESSERKSKFGLSISLSGLQPDQYLMPLIHSHCVGEQKKTILALSPVLGKQIVPGDFIWSAIFLWEHSKRLGERKRQVHLPESLMGVFCRFEQPWGRKITLAWSRVIRRDI